MISEIPSHPRCIVKIQDNNPPITAPKPRLFPMISQAIQQHHQQQQQNRPLSPPLPPPPPPPPVESMTVCQTPPVSARPTITAMGLRPLATSNTTFAKIPSPLIRRSLSDKSKEQKDKMRQNSDPALEEVSRPQVYRKPGNLFLAQLYFLFHLALTVCLLRASGWQKRSKISFHETILYYYSYLLGTSILFIFLIRCWKNDYSYSKDSKPENTAVLLGSISLGLIQLISIGLDFAQCIHKQFIFLPILQFIFVFLLMHFVLTQARHGPKLGFSNIAVAHLLTTLVSLWIINFDPNYGPCGYAPGQRNNSGPNDISRNILFPSTFTDMLMPIIHHYQLLTIFILITMWFMNNDTKLSVVRTISGDNYSDSLAFSFFKRKNSIKGFFLGLLVVSASIIVLILGESDLSIITHTSIQGISAMAAMIGLVLRGKKESGANKPPATFSSPNQHHLLIFVTIFATYYCAISVIISNLISRNVNINAIIDGTVMIIHATFQTFLLRSDGRKLDKMREVFAFLILSNFSLWVLEVTQTAAAIAETGASSILILPPLLMSLNRFYSSLVFIQFWKKK